MIVFRPSINPTHNFKIISNGNDLTTILIDDVSVPFTVVSYLDGYLSGTITFEFEEGKQYEIKTNPDIYKGKAYATDFPDLNDYVINVVNANTIEL